MLTAVARVSTGQAPRTTRNSETNPFRPGRPKRGHRGKDQDRAVYRQQRVQAAKFTQLARVRLVINHTDQEEHTGRVQAVVEHLQHRAVEGDDAIFGALAPAPRRQSPSTTKPMWLIEE